MCRNTKFKEIQVCLYINLTLSSSLVEWHYIMSAMASQITGVSIVCSTFTSGADQRKHQSSASQAFVRAIHRWPMDSPHKGPVTRKMFPFDDVIKMCLIFRCFTKWCEHYSIYTYWSYYALCSISPISTVHSNFGPDTLIIYGKYTVAIGDRWAPYRAPEVRHPVDDLSQPGFRTYVSVLATLCAYYYFSRPWYLLLVHKWWIGLHE